MTLYVTSLHTTVSTRPRVRPLHIISRTGAPSLDSARNFICRSRNTIQTRRPNISTQLYWRWVSSLAKKATGSFNVLGKLLQRYVGVQVPMQGGRVRSSAPASCLFRFTGQWLDERGKVRSVRIELPWRRGGSRHGGACRSGGDFEFLSLSPIQITHVYITLYECTL